MNKILLETPTIEKDLLYGLPEKIWLGSDENAQHNDYRIKFLNNNSLEPLRLTSNGVKLANNKTIDDISMSSKNFYKLCTWMILYKDIIISYYNFYNKDPEINKHLKYALLDRSEELKQNGISDYLIPFDKCKNGVVYKNNITFNVNQPQNILVNYKIKEEENHQEEDQFKEEGVKEAFDEILRITKIEDF